MTRRTSGHDPGMRISPSPIPAAVTPPPPAPAHGTAQAPPAVDRAVLGASESELKNLSPSERRKRIQARLDLMQSRFLPHRAKGMNEVFQIIVTGPGGGTWHTIVRNGTSVLKSGPHPNPSVTMKASGEDWLALLEYRLHRIKAFLTGRLKIDGDRGLAKQFRDLYPDPNRPKDD